MKAAFQTALRRMEIRHLPAPTLQYDTDVLLKVEMVGICGSDVQRYTTGRIGSQVAGLPYLGGHECAGIVTEIGSAVTHVKINDRVAVDPAISCHQCDRCRAGHENTCRNLKFLGVPGETQGCLCEYLVMPQECLYPVTHQLSVAQAVLCEPLSIGLYAARQAQITQGTNIAILGAGPIGLCTLIAARNAGANGTYVTEIVAERISVAENCRPTWVGNPRQLDVVRTILDQQSGGLDAVFECAGTQETIDQGIDLLRPGGKLMLIGIPHEQRISLSIDKMRREEITVINVKRHNHCVGPAIELVASGKVDVDFMVTHTFPLDQAHEAFELAADYRDGVIKAMIEI